MSSPVRTTLVGALLLPLLSHLPQAEDASVKVRLEARGVKYVVDDDGDFRVTYNYSKEKRTQLESPAAARAASADSASAKSSRRPRGSKRTASPVPRHSN